MEVAKNKILQHGRETIHSKYILVPRMWWSTVQGKMVEPSGSCCILTDTNMTLDADRERRNQTSVAQEYTHRYTGTALPLTAQLRLLNSAKIYRIIRAQNMVMRNYFLQWCK